MMTASHGDLTPRGYASTYDYGSKFTQVKELDNVRGRDLSGIESAITVAPTENTDF
jgi:hypothetical protein